MARTDVIKRTTLERGSGKAINPDGEAPLICARHASLVVIDIKRGIAMRRSIGAPVAIDEVMGRSRRCRRIHGGDSSGDSHCQLAESSDDLDLTAKCCHVCP
jgi:hypothetical protein